MRDSCRRRGGAHVKVVYAVTFGRIAAAQCGAVPMAPPAHFFVTARHHHGDPAMAVHLNFINRSNDTNNARIVIFQKNAARNTGEIPIAWRVID